MPLVPASAIPMDGRLLWGMFEKIDLGIFVHDSLHRVIAFNTAAEKMTGYRRETVIGKDCRTVFNVDFCDRACNLCKGATNKKIRYHQETQKLNRDGTLSWIDLSAFLVGGEGGPVFHVVVLKEVTEAKVLQEHVGHVVSCCKIVGKSDPIKKIFHMIRTMAETDISVLIMGETGVGKELISAAIHKHSPRKSKPFIKTNCAGLPESLIESELFGHSRGAFTGAVSDRIGRFEAASGGTIFLDEIGELSLSVQSKLLRVLQEKEIERLGEQKTRKVNFRIIAATNRDLLAEVKRGRFREDLYYRLAGVILDVPPLRNRQEDIPLLVHHFLAEFNRKYGKNIKGASPDLMKELMNHPWPGNIRELYNLLESTYIMQAGTLLTGDSVPNGHLNVEENSPVRSQPSVGPLSQKAHVGLPEEERIVRTLETNRFNISATAKELRMGRTTLWRKMKSYGISSKAV